MPPRVARSSIPTAAPKNAKNKSRKRNLDAYSIASHAVEPSKIASHRLGEVVDDAPRHKRRRTDEDEDEASERDDTSRGKILKSRGRVLAQNGDDGIEQGSDSEGNEWTLGGLAEDDEDSDLDSDEAFGESDEERFEGFTFRGSRSTNRSARKAPRRRDRFVENEQANLEENEEQEDSSDEGVDLATMLDNEDNEGDADEDEDGEDGTELYGESDEASSGSDDEEDDEVDEAEHAERYARLRDRLEALDPVSQGSDTAQNAVGTAGLTLEDLLDDVDPLEKKQILATIKPKRKSQRAERLTAPLPKRQQDRLNREVASQKAKEQLDRWRDTVIHNRRAEFLSFPLVDPSQPNPAGKDKFITNTEPGNELEESIRRIMEESGMVSKQGQYAEDEETELLKAEALATKDLPVEEVMRRRAELRRARDLLFREEIKAKRIAKIKSKSYRRVHRKERLRLAEAERMAQEMEDSGEDEEQRERHDRRRAQERMSTKHRDSKFAKALKATNRSVWDDDARNGVMEQVRRREELKRRIAGQDGAHDDRDFEHDDSVGEEEESQQYLDKLDGEQEVTQKKGLAGMAFMRAAEDRQRARNAEDIERLRKELAVEDGDEEESEDEQGDEQGIGRAIFGPKPKEATFAGQRQKRPELEEGDESADELGIAVEDQGQPQPLEGASKSMSKHASNSVFKNDTKSRGKGATDALQDRRVPVSQQQKTDNTIVSALLRSPSPPSKRQPREMPSLLTAPIPGRSRKSRVDKVGALIELLDDEPAQPHAKSSQNGRKVGQDKGTAQTSSKHEAAEASNTTAASTSGWQTIPFASNDDSDEHDEDHQNTAHPVLTPAEQRAALLDRAFAGGDDSATTFAAEKAAAIASEDEQEISTHLPGWGSWTGVGLSKAIRKQNKKQAHNPLFKNKLPGVKAEDRKDKALANVIISEKTDRKGKKFLAPVLPHEFERKEQYERSLRVPVGPEWTTKEVFQRGTRPRVVVKPGVVVAPMERPLL